MDIAGKWIYSEDFEGGVDVGEALILQSENNLCGYLKYTETTTGDAPSQLKQQFTGVLIDNTVVLKGVSIKILNGDRKAVFNLDSWEGKINSEGNIVGFSIDQAGVCGVFTLTRKQKSSDSKKS